MLITKIAKKEVQLRYERLFQDLIYITDTIKTFILMHVIFIYMYLFLHKLNKILYVLY